MSTTVLQRPSQFNQRSLAAYKAPQSIPRKAEEILFTEGELESLRRDDAMTGGMISVILGCAFLVLLGLVIGVCIWTTTAVA